MLYQIIYVSKRKCSDEEITKILNKSREKNQKKNITGLLLFSKDNFIQCIEGEKDDIMELYNVIKKDQRHANSVVISYKPIQKRDFPAWSMGEKRIDLDKLQLMTDMTDEEKQSFENILSGKEDTKAIDIIKRLLDK